MSHEAICPLAASAACPFHHEQHRILRISHTDVCFQVWPGMPPGEGPAGARCRGGTGVLIPASPEHRRGSLEMQIPKIQLNDCLHFHAKEGKFFSCVSCVPLIKLQLLGLSGTC